MATKIGNLIQNKKLINYKNNLSLLTLFIYVNFDNI